MAQVNPGLSKYYDVTFDSSLRSRGSLSKPEFDWPMGIPAKDIVGAQLVSTNIPYSFFTLDRAINELWVSSNVGGDVSEATVYLEPGTYSADSFSTMFRQAFAQIPISTPIEGNLGFVLAPLPYNSHFVLYNQSDSYTQSDSFSIRVDNPDLAHIMGLEPNVTYTSQWLVVYRDGVALNNGNPMQSIYFPMQMALSPTCLHIFSNLTGSVDNQFAMLPQTPEHRSIRPKESVLAVVPITGNYTSIMYNANVGQMVPLNGVDGTIEFWIGIPDRVTKYAFRKPLGTDVLTESDLMDYVDLNGKPFQVTVRFQVDTGITYPAAM